MKYYAVKDNVTEAVLYLRRSLLDFLDFGTRVPAPGGVWAWGWIEIEIPITPGLLAFMGLVTA